MDGSTISPFGVFAAALAASATAGIAAYLRSNKPVTKLALITAALNSGLLGLAISLLLIDKMKGTPFFLIGVCVITGLSGAAGLDLVLTAIQKGGFQIKFGTKEDADGNVKVGFGFGEEKKEKEEAPK